MFVGGQADGESADQVTVAAKVFCSEECIAISQADAARRRDARERDRQSLRDAQARDG